MSKYVKDLMTESLRQRLQGVDDALLVNMVGLDANTSARLREELRAKNIYVMVVKNSLAARATAGTPLARLFEGLTGSCAICWGGDDIVTLAKEVVRLAKKEELAPFVARRGVLDGEPLTPEQIEQVSKWPSRQEQLAILLGQILGPGARLMAQLTGPGAALASQIAQRGGSESSSSGPSGEAGG